MKVIFDTNILIPAAFRGGKLKIAIAYVLASSSFKWIASSEIIKEYKEVLNLPKLQLFHEEDDSKKLEQQKLGQLEMGVNPSPN